MSFDSEPFRGSCDQAESGEFVIPGLARTLVRGRTRNPGEDKRKRGVRFKQLRTVCWPLGSGFLPLRGAPE